MSDKLSEEDYTVHCISCHTTNDLQMWPHRDEEGRMVGWVYACTECEKKLPDAKLTITYQDDQNQVVKGTAR